MEEGVKKQKVVIVGAGPVGSLAALYAARRGDIVELYELRGGTCKFSKQKSQLYRADSHAAFLVYIS